MASTSKKTTRQYRADRDFNELKAGDVVEMADDHPYLSTGYMQEVTDGADADAAGAGAGAGTGGSR